MTNIQKHVIDSRADKQHKLKNKNDGKAHSTGRGYLADVEYVKSHGKGSFCKGLMKLCIEHQSMDMMMNKINDDNISVKQEVISNFVNDFRDNISLILPEVADNHLHAFPALFSRYLASGKWEPEKFLKVKDGEKKDDKSS